MPSTTPTTFLTGATGFVGAAVARLLLAKGHRLKALARPGGDRRNLAGLTLEIVEGDLGQPDSYRAALAGCDALFHVAADYRLWVPQPAAMHAINVKGTEDLLLAAQAAGIRRMVYTSSVAALGTFYDGRVSDETTPVGFKDMVGVYKQSKFLAEEAVHKLVRENSMPVVIVNPSTPIGPRDIKPTPTGRIIVDGAAGKIPAYVDTGLNIAHVDDVAMGHWLAYEKGRVGERYILGGENLGLGDILTIIANLVGRKPPTVKLPRGLIMPVAVIAETLSRFTGKEPLVTVDALRMSKKKMFFFSRQGRARAGLCGSPGQGRHRRRDYMVQGQWLLLGWFSIKQNRVIPAFAGIHFW